MGKSEAAAALSTDHFRLGVALFVGYSLLSCLRKPLSSTYPLIKEEFLLSSSQYGVLVSNYSLIFGIAKLIGGVLSDVVPPKALFLSSILLATVSCVGISVCTSFELISVCWAVNGLAQGLCWPAVSKMITSCFPASVMGTLWSILSCATSAGAIVTPTLLLLLMPFGWRRVFQVISLVGLVAASAAYVLIINEDSLASKVAIDNQTTVTVVASPAAIFAAKDSMDDGDKSKIEKKEESITRQPENYSLLETLAFNVEVQFVFISAMFAYFALTMLTDWLSLYLAEYALQNMEQTTELLVWLELGTLVGAFVSGILSDILYGQRAATAMLFALVSVPILLYFPSCQLREIAQYEASGGSSGNRALILTPYWGSLSSTEVDSAGIYNIARLCIFLSGFAMNGPKTLLGMCIRSAVANIKIVGTIGGLLGLVGQCGAYTGSMLLAHLLTGKTSEKYSVWILIPEYYQRAVLQYGDIGMTVGSSHVSSIWQTIVPLLRKTYTAWELFPLLYMFCGTITVLLLIIPMFSEGRRRYLQQKNQKDALLMEITDQQINKKKND